ncbi:EAL domain-containing protein [Methylobacterium sp. BTF04]|uniref:EAL domain-containing protein n=1 Tax=Methylobacterium sp. BTF04 TaxID=2708300 RepID=UPI0013D4C5D8|nr:EAL domain-containing protein [Methylobacterium sp. BTF04]NEU14863.1 EAL domain-containing protein [Methylobacterium sp. BTF04]
MGPSKGGLEPIGAWASAGGDVIQDALVAIRNHLGMEVAYFSEFIGGRTVFRRVDAPGLEHLIKVGDSHALDDVYCNHILAGRLPELIADTSLVVLAREMPITAAVPIGSHISIAIRLLDGTPFGMFCCLSPRPIPSLNERDLATMRVFAGLAARQVNAGLQQRRDAQQIHGRITAVIAAEEYDIVLQPIFDLQSRTVISCEALCRFRALPYRSPDKWFKDATDAGLGCELELAVLRTTLAVFPLLPCSISLSVNASPELVISGRLSDLIPAQYADRTIIEITEHASVSSYAELHAQLAPLKQLGVKVAVDDAGAGYSGLQHIVQLGPDIIKMDMSLTRAIDTDPARRALASAMVFYAREMGSRIVAEGIETTEELSTLKLLGADRGQGYLLGKPGNIAALGAACTATHRAAA